MIAQDRDLLARLVALIVAGLLLGLAAATLSGCRTTPVGTVPARPEIDSGAWGPVLDRLEAWGELTAEEALAAMLARASVTDSDGDGLVTLVELEALAAVADAYERWARATLAGRALEDELLKLAALREGVVARIGAAGG